MERWFGSVLLVVLTGFTVRRQPWHNPTHGRAHFTRHDSRRPPSSTATSTRPIWSKAARLNGFRQVQPGDNLAPSQPTEVLIGYDRRALYLAFRASDPPATCAPRSPAATRLPTMMSSAFTSTRFTIGDAPTTSSSTRNGVQADGIYTEGQAQPDLTVDLVIDSKGTIDATATRSKPRSPSPRCGIEAESRRRGDCTCNALSAATGTSRSPGCRCHAIDRACSTRPVNSESSPISAKAGRSKSSRPAWPPRPARQLRPALLKAMSIRNPASR